MDEALKVSELKAKKDAVGRIEVISTAQKAGKHQRLARKIVLERGLGSHED